MNKKTLTELGLIYSLMLASSTELETKRLERKNNKKKVDLVPKNHNMTEVNINNGLKLFIIEGSEIWALNEKNAIKKYNKQFKQI